MAEAMEAAYFSFDVVDLPLWLDLMDAMDARGAGTEQLRDDLRWSAEEAQSARAGRSPAREEVAGQTVITEIQGDGNNGNG